MDYPNAIVIENSILTPNNLINGNENETKGNNKIQKKNEFEEIKDFERVISNFENVLKLWQDSSKIQNLIDELKNMIKMQKKSKILEGQLTRIKNIMENQENKKVNKIKKIFVKFEPYLKELYGKIMNNKDEKLYNINILVPDEINRKINNLDKIILINEENSNKIKKILFYDLINIYLNSSPDEKNKILNNNILDFNKLYNILVEEDIISEKISLIYSFSECQYNINNTFFILNRERFKDIYPEAANIDIYYFKYNNRSYVYFQKDQVIAEINKDDNYNQNGLCKLNKYEITELELLKYIKLGINKNKNIFNTELSDFFENNIKEFYIINSNYIINSLKSLENKYAENNLEEKNEIEPFKRSISFNNFEFDYPIIFEIFEKQNFENAINTLKTKNISFNKILISTILFVNEDNKNIKNKNQKKYIGIFGEVQFNTIIYFYSFNNDKYSFEFLIKYNKKYIDHEIIKIIDNGILIYLSNNNINIEYNENELVKEITQNIYNEENKKVGFFVKKTPDKSNHNLQPHSKGLEFEISDNFNQILLCLINLEPFRDYFINNKKEFKFQDNYIISYYFYKITQDLWISNYEGDKKIYFEFREKIKEYIKSNKILIDFILQSLHNESINIEFGKSFKLKEDLNNYLSKSKSIFQDNFFFKLKQEKICNECKIEHKQYSYHCALEIRISKQISKIITLNDLLNIKMLEKQLVWIISMKKIEKKDVIN